MEIKIKCQFLNEVFIMSHSCFISFKKEDEHYKDKIIEKLGKERIVGKSLDTWIDSDNIDYVMQVIREKYMKGTTVTLFLIGCHSSENEGLDENGYNKQSYIIRELQATLYDREGNPRDGLLGIVLPGMENIIYNGNGVCPRCGKNVETVSINDSTVIREFSANYWLIKNKCGHYDETGRFAVLCKYSDFINDPDRYIDAAFNKTKEEISNSVHFRDIDHRGKLGSN